jgi:hypothetical protein
VTTFNNGVEKADGDDGRDNDDDDDDDGNDGFGGIDVIGTDGITIDIGNVDIVVKENRGV